MVTLSRRTVLRAMAGVSLATSVNTKTVAREAQTSSSEYAALPGLDIKQSGHLRHARNIAAQLPGDFSYMQGNDPDNIGDFVGYRWQLSHMMDAMALAYQHHLPAAPGVFQADYRLLIDKLLRQESWNYWREMSRFSKGKPPEGVAPGEGWWDPIVKENIFYSGILANAIAQYAYFFNDESFDRVGAITFERPKYAKGPEKVEYSLQTVLDTIYWQMVENGYLGVACQPDMVFNSCSQFPIRAFNYQDRRKGTTRAAEVIAAHRSAWGRLGGYINGKPMPCVHMMSANKTIDIPWGLGYFVFNTWNPEYFSSTYPMTKSSIVRKSGTNRLEVYSPSQYGETEKAFLAGLPQPAVKRQSKGGEAVAGAHGTVALFLSEAGDPDLDILMAQVDAHMSPTWVDGGLYYPRRDADWDDEGNVIGVTPTCTPSYALARLNKRDGLHDLFANPMPASRWADPYIADTSRNIDVARAIFIANDNKLVTTLRPPRGTPHVHAELSLANVTREGQSWTLTVDGRKVASGTPSGDIRSSLSRTVWQGDNLAIALPVSHPTDLVLHWA